MKTQTRGTRERCRGEQGETLVELLFAMGILAVAITVIVGSMATAISLAVKHREQARAATMLVTAAENIKHADYVPCDGGAPAYPTGLTLPSGWSADDSSVKTIDAAGNMADCPAADTKLQQVTVTVTSPNGYTARTNVVKRNKA